MLVEMRSNAFKDQRELGFIRGQHNGGLFNGSMVRGQPDGFGLITFMPNDEFGRFNYTGTWRKGLLDGYGVIFWKNGAKYLTSCIMFIDWLLRIPSQPDPIL